MRYFELFENTSEALFRHFGGKIMRFSDLPNNAQKAISHYMTVEGDNPNFAKEMLFGYVMLPAEELKKFCWNAPSNDMRDDHPDWKSYHDSYWKGENDADYTDHLVNMWPVILDDDEGVLDGWHRLHWYLRKGVTKIPAIWITEK